MSGFVIGVIIGGIFVFVWGLLTAAEQIPALHWKREARIARSQRDVFREDLEKARLQRVFPDSTISRGADGKFAPRYPVVRTREEMTKLLAGARK